MALAEKQASPIPKVPPAPEVPHTTIRPSHGWISLRLDELWQYRELLIFLVWRDVKVRYKQTIMGASWAIIQPLMSMIVFTIFFGGLAGIEADGGIPYPVFSYTALVPWTFFAGAMAQSSNSLVGSANLLKKVYFPRLVIPIASALSLIVDFVLAFIVLLLMVGFYLLTQSPTTDLTMFFAAMPVDPLAFPAGIAITANIVWLPFFVLLALVTALGVGLWLSAMNVQFRDIKYVIPFLTQIWLFITPIVYPSSLIQNDLLRTLYGINPMAGVVEGFRWALLGVDSQPGPIIIVSTIVALLLLVSGALYFRRMEKTFADVV